VAVRIFTGWQRAVLTFVCRVNAFLSRTSDDTRRTSIADDSRCATQSWPALGLGAPAKTTRRHAIGLRLSPRGRSADSRLCQPQLHAREAARAAVLECRQPAPIKQCRPPR
jgi:hypothetical protein